MQATPTFPSDLNDRAALWAFEQSTAPLKERLEAAEMLARTVACSTCAALEGRACKSSHGNPKRSAHLPRLDAARKQAAADRAARLEA